MLIYLNHITRYISNTSFCYYCFVKRRYYTSQKLSLNHYDVLRIKSDATAKEIKTAFYSLSKKNHPDVNPDDVDAAKKFSTISNAYDILGDPIKRREYDNELVSKRNNNSAEPYNTYARRARAHRPSTWKSPRTSYDFGKEFQKNEKNFTNSRSTNYGTSSGQYSDLSEEERSNTDGFKEYHWNNYTYDKNWYNMNEESQRQQEKVTHITVSKLISMCIYLTLGIIAFFISSFLCEMHFKQPTEEIYSRFVNNSNRSNRKLSRQLSIKSSV